MKNASYSWIITHSDAYWIIRDRDLHRPANFLPHSIPELFESAEKSKLDVGRTNVRTYGRTNGRIGEPTGAAGDSHGISIPARPATSYSMRVYHSEKRMYARTQARRTLKRMYDGFVAAPPTEDIGVLSYSFHHNNSPAYKYRRTVRLHGGRLRLHWKVPRFNFALPFAPTATLFFSSSVSLPPSSLPLSPFAPSSFSARRSSASRSPSVLDCSQTEPPPLLHLWPFELNLLTVALFLMAHFLPRNCYLNSFRVTCVRRATGYFRLFRLARSLSLVM